MEKSLKFNSQICTTKEQSERLLKLGLKKETADCYLFEYDKEKYKVIAESWLDLIVDKKYYSQYKDVCLPAWSLHRLMLIANANDTAFLNIENMYETLIKMIASNIKWGFINKDYLEEKQ